MRGNAPDNRVNSDSPSRCSFVANATSLAPLRSAGYAKRYEHGEPNGR